MSATETKALVERLKKYSQVVGSRWAQDNSGLLSDAMTEAAAALEPLTREPDADQVERVARAIYEVMPHYDLDQGFAVMSWDDLVAFEEGAGYTPTITVLRDKARAAIAALPRRDAMREVESAVAFVRRLASYDNASETIANWSAINDDDCDPDFEAGYDAVIEQAREVVAKLDRATEEPGHGA